MTADILSVFQKDQVVTPADGQSYEAAISRWADNAIRRAQYVVFPRTAQEVGQAIRFAVDNSLELAIKGGGHSTSGASSSTGLVIDLSRHFATVAVDAEKRLISVGGGAVWADVDKEAAKFGLATVGGTVNHTGVGGLTVGGGYGWLTGKYGLTIDNLVEAEVVLANGSVVTCSESENADLFWGIRGGGSNFGPVTKFVLKGYPQTNKVWSGMVIYHPSKLQEIIGVAREWAKQASENESAMIVFVRSPHDGQPAIALAPFYNGPTEEARQKFARFLAIEHILDRTQEIPYEMQNGMLNASAEHGHRKILRGAPFVTLDADVAMHVWNEYVKFTSENPETHKSVNIIELHPNHKVLAVPREATAFANRGPYFTWMFSMHYENPAMDTTCRAWSAELAKHVRAVDAKLSGLDPDSVRGYSNYGFGDEAARNVFGDNYERLREIKAKYDPNMVFRKWFPIIPKGMEEKTI